eukprot:3220872-Pyramimonas_sp.AAC.1
MHVKLRLAGADRGQILQIFARALAADYFNRLSQELACCSSRLSLRAGGAPKRSMGFVCTA